MKKILVVISSFLPGENGGGPVQSIKNLVDNTGEMFSYWIITLNKDINSNNKYEDIHVNQWEQKEKYNIFYYDNVLKIYDEVKKNSFDLILFNSFFSKDTIITLFFYTLLKLDTPIVMMTRGQLTKGALKIKKNKKILFIKLVKKLKIIKKMFFVVTIDEEKKNIIRLLEVDKVSLLSNIPNTEKRIQLSKENDSLNLVFLSRITPKKNLDYSIRVLSHCKKDVNFYIYGILEDLEYWNYCLEEINKLPENIHVIYNGALKNQEVISTLSKFDVFFLCTLSENYGHVISEALQASLPLLISNTTPWTNLESKGFGWDFPLENPDSFSKKIDELANESKAYINSIKNHIYTSYNVVRESENSSQQHIELFNTIIDSKF